MILERIDKDNEAADHLQVDDEEIILGRNPALKITDTKISRHVGKISFDNNEYLLIGGSDKQPVHWKKSLSEDTWQVLEKAEKIKLEEGFVIALTPDKYLYEFKKRVESSSNTIPSPRPRPSCAYAKDGCIRKNPQHFQDEAHPGDADYVEATESEAVDDNDDERPECEYGLDCYRKNPEHRKEYKHSVKVRPKRKAKENGKKRKKAKEEDDFDSSFIDDEEEEEEDISHDEESVDEWTPDDDED